MDYGISAKETRKEVREGGNGEKGCVRKAHVGRCSCGVVLAF